MTKKMKGVLAMDPYLVNEDHRVGSFKHHSLIQDFQDLEKETDTIREGLEGAKLKKLTLLAEVSFLRRRYNFLMKNQLSTNPQSKQDQVPAKNLMNRSKKTGKQKSYNAKEAGLPPLVPRIKRNQKGNIYSGKESNSMEQSPSFDLNHNDRVSNRKEVGVLNLAPNLDLNRNVIGARETDYTSKGATTRKMTPIFDLNQISREEELHFEDEPLRFEENRSSIPAFNEEQHNDMKLSICRNIGNGSNRAGKRKISMALRV